jgi:hypothetical protein
LEQQIGRHPGQTQQQLTTNHTKLHHAYTLVLIRTGIPPQHREIRHKPPRRLGAHQKIIHVILVVHITWTTQNRLPQRPPLLWRIIQPDPRERTRQIQLILRKCHATQSIYNFHKAFLQHAQRIFVYKRHAVSNGKGMSAG